MVDDEEREARSDEGREEKSEHTRVSWGETEAAIARRACTNYIRNTVTANRRHSETGSRVNCSGAGGIDNI